MTHNFTQWLHWHWCWQDNWWKMLIIRDFIIIISIKYSNKVPRRQEDLFITSYPLLQLSVITHYAYFLFVVDVGVKIPMLSSYQGISLLPFVSIYLHFLPFTSLFRNSPAMFIAALLPAHQCPSYTLLHSNDPVKWQTRKQSSVSQTRQNWCIVAIHLKIGTQVVQNENLSSFIGTTHIVYI